MNFKEYISIDVVNREISSYGFKRVGDHVEVYHGTSRRRANKIGNEGFKIRSVKYQTMGGDPESHRDYIWFAKNWNDAKAYAELHNQPAIITVRIPVEFLKNKRSYFGPVSLWIKKEVPLEYISSIKSVK